MTVVATLKVRISAAFSFCLIVVGLADVLLLAGTGARVTCVDCPVLSVNPQASIQQSRTTAGAAEE